MHAQLLDTCGTMQKKCTMHLTKKAATLVTWKNAINKIVVKTEKVQFPKIKETSLIMDSFYFFVLGKLLPGI